MNLILHDFCVEQSPTFRERRFAGKHTIAREHRISHAPCTLGTMRQQGWVRSREARADVCRGRDLLKEKRLGRQAAVPAEFAPSVNARQFDCLLPLAATL